VGQVVAWSPVNPAHQPWSIAAGETAAEFVFQAHSFLMFAGKLP
jgi:hypothetical protein